MLRRAAFVCDGLRIRLARSWRRWFLVRQGYVFDEGAASPVSDEAAWLAVQARRRRAIVCRALGCAMLLSLAGWLVFAKAVHPTRSDIHARALVAPRHAQPFRPPYPADPAVLASVDMAKVHGDLFPAWTVALAESPYTLGRDAAEKAFLALRIEAGKDRNLAVLLDDLHE
jgi:hypothetical protein